MNEREQKAWNEFRDSGLLWWINRSLHLFGYALVITCNEGEILSIIPERVNYRGFPEDKEDAGFLKLQTYLADNAKTLLEDLQG